MKLKFCFDKLGNSILQHQEFNNFSLKQGSEIPSVRVGYSVYGTSLTNPIILIHPALTGSTQLFHTKPSEQGDGWWSRFVGPGLFLDTNRFTVIGVDHLGGNGESSSASELQDYSDEIVLQDTVHLTVLLMNHLEINLLYAVIGGSLGAAQTFEWLFQKDIQVERIVDISGNCFAGGLAQDFFHIQARLLTSSTNNVSPLTEKLKHNIQNLIGRTQAFDLVFAFIEEKLITLDQNYSKIQALKITRMIGFLRFLTPVFFQKKWEKAFNKIGDEAVADTALLTWLEDHGESFSKRFSPMALASLCAMEVRFKKPSPESIAEQINKKNIQLIGFSVAGDVLFDADLQFQFYKNVKQCLPNDKQQLVDIHFAYDEINGHDHFLSQRFEESARILKKVLFPGEPLQAFQTRAIHKGHIFKDNTGALISPIYLTSTFARGNSEGFDYTRSGNPNFVNLEKTLSSLEDAHYATVFASGVSAITAIVSSLKSGDLVLAEEVIYGCTYRLFDKVFSKFGVSVEYLDFTDPEQLEQISLKRPAMVWIESPTNPLLKIIDIKEVSNYSKRVGSTLVVDNTFASSYNQTPLKLGADISFSSTTKYINGHSDCLGGIVCTNSEKWYDAMVFAQKALGLNPAPFDSWLILRGIKTLALRMEQHHKNATAIAEFLEKRAEVNYVRYPFGESHPQMLIAKKQMTGASGIVTVEFNFSKAETDIFLASLENFTLAESLGGIESLVCHPASMSHGSLPYEQRQKIGITDNLLRFSVGIESCKDLISDLQNALEVVGNANQ